MPAKGMVESSNITRFISFTAGLATRNYSAFISGKLRHAFFIFGKSSFLDFFHPLFKRGFFYSLLFFFIINCTMDIFNTILHPTFQERDGRRNNKRYRSKWTILWRVGHYSKWHLKDGSLLQWLRQRVQRMFTWQWLHWHDRLLFNVTETTTW